jgi:hypothetical protein
MSRHNLPVAFQDTGSETDGFFWLACAQNVAMLQALRGWSRGFRQHVAWPQNDPGLAARVHPARVATPPDGKRQPIS